MRNIAALSEVNPDTRPVGIYVEADTTVIGNTVDAVPGIGILAGYGPFLRNVIISSNMISGAETGIAVTRYGEYRLTETNLRSTAEPETFALHVDLCLPAGFQTAAPFAGRKERRNGH